MKKTILSSLAVLGIIGFGVCQAQPEPINPIERPKVVIHGFKATVTATGERPNRAEVVVINGNPYTINASGTSLEGIGHGFAISRNNTNAIMFHGMTCPITTSGNGNQVQKVDIWLKHINGKPECNALVTYRPKY